MSDDDAIWHDIAKTVKPLKNRKPAVAPPKKIARKAIRSMPPVLAPPKTTASPPPQSRIRQLKQQKIPVQRKLDLHGMTLARGLDALLAFMANCYRNDLRCVEIITGRGDPEKGTGAMRRHVPIWLRENTAISAFILHFEENSLSRGGSLLVLLRRNKTAA